LDKQDENLAAFLRNETREASHTNESLHFKLLLQWLQQCNQEHGDYNCVPENTQKSFRPTRLLYVGSQDSPKLQLMETKSMNKGEGVIFVSLSHCWGCPTDEEKERYCTTRENYQERLDGFSTKKLPKTFDDAVKITRALEQKYIWIDALCIIQGVKMADDEDWENEAGLMEETYGSAYFNIAADSASNWNSGFLPFDSAHLATDASQSGEPIYTCDTGYKFNFNKDVNNSKLNKRAWVLQERVLSHRTLHFAENHTYFACGMGVRCGSIGDQEM
jgi:hypothetical protein